MFGKYRMALNRGINPPYSPAYPMEFGCTLRTLDVMTRVDKKKLQTLLADTPFEVVNDRVAFQFMASPGHTLATHTGRMYDLMVTIAVRYKDLFTQNHIYMYCSDPMGICSGRELFGYTKKDCYYQWYEAEDGVITSTVNRRGFPLAEVKFTPDPKAPVIRLADGAEQPAGEIHVRRVPDPTREGATAYSDIMYRRTPLSYAAPIAGRAEMTLHPSAFDPLTELEPEVISAQFQVSDVYGGGLKVEDRRLFKL